MELCSVEIAVESLFIESVFCSTRFFITPMRSLNDCCMRHLLLELLDLGLQLNDFLANAPDGESRRAHERGQNKTMGQG